MEILRVGQGKDLLYGTQDQPQIRGVLDKRVWFSLSRPEKKEGELLDGAFIQG